MWSDVILGSYKGHISEISKWWQTDRHTTTQIQNQPKRVFCDLSKALAESATVDRKPGQPEKHPQALNQPPVPWFSEICSFLKIVTWTRESQWAGEAPQFRCELPGLYKDQEVWITWSAKTYNSVQVGRCAKLNYFCHLAVIIFISKEVYTYLSCPFVIIAICGPIPWKWKDSALIPREPKCAWKQIQLYFYLEVLTC